MQLLIAVDMEGISGVTGWNQVFPDNADYSQARHWMTADVNAAIQGAVQAGVKEILVTDGHYEGRNILFEEFSPPARLISGGPSPLSMVQGVQKQTDAAVFIGYHARAGTQNAILDHTWSSKKVHNLWLNGILAGEIALNAAICGEFGVPVIAISGDQSACAEAAALIPGINTAQVKKTNARMSAECLPLSETHEMITVMVKEAVKNMNMIKPYRITSPVIVKVEFFNSDMADRAQLLPGSHRIDGRIVEFTGKGILEALQAFRAMVGLAQV